MPLPPLFLEYRSVKARTRLHLLNDGLEKSKQLDLPDTLQDKTGYYHRYQELNADASLWIDSLLHKKSSGSDSLTPYEIRQALAEALTEFEQTLEAAFQERKKGRPFYLQYLFAGVSALIPTRSFLILLAIVASLMLMIMSLAVMAQAGVLLAGTWVLGTTLTSAALWLAAHLSITTLGLPALITLAVVGAWLAAAFIAEWKFPGGIENVFFGLASMDADGNNTDTMIHMTRLKKPQYPTSLNDFILIGKRAGTIDRRTSMIFSLPVFLLMWSHVWLFDALNAFAIYFTSPQPATEYKPQPSSLLFFGFKWLLHLIFVAISIPFVALLAIVDSCYLAGEFVYKLFRKAEKIESVPSASFSPSPSSRFPLPPDVKSEEVRKPVTDLSVARMDSYCQWTKGSEEQIRKIRSMAKQEDMIALYNVATKQEMLFTQELIQGNMIEHSIGNGIFCYEKIYGGGFLEGSPDLVNDQGWSCCVCS